VNPRVGCGLQQCLHRRFGETAEVVRNHEGGTRSLGGTGGPKIGTRTNDRASGSSVLDREWTNRTENRRRGTSRRRRDEVGGWSCCMVLTSVRGARNGSDLDR
jgi:hypothetical protein